MTLHISKKTQKSKFLLSQAFKWENNLFFVIPEIPSKTFVMVKKKLPEHFKPKPSLLLRLPEPELAHFQRLQIFHITDIVLGSILKIHDSVPAIHTETRSRFQLF